MIHGGQFVLPKRGGESGRRRGRWRKTLKKKNVICAFDRQRYRHTSFASIKRRSFQTKPKKKRCRNSVPSMPTTSLNVYHHSKQNRIHRRYAAGNYALSDIIRFFCTHLTRAVAFIANGQYRKLPLQVICAVFELKLRLALLAFGIFGVSIHVPRQSSIPHKLPLYGVAVRLHAE